MTFTNSATTSPLSVHSRYPLFRDACQSLAKPNGITEKEIDVSTEILGRAVRVEMQSHCHVNGSDFTYNGVSQGKYGNGDIECSVKLGGQIPSGYSPVLLAAHLLTGQPSMSHICGDAVNPFIGTRGRYHATRTLDLGSSGALTTSYRVDELEPGLLTAFFHQTGEVNLPELSAVLPTVETWIPRGPGRIDGTMSFSFLTREGNIVPGLARTQYFLPSPEVLPGVEYRDIHIDVRVSDDFRDFRQVERIVLFTPATLSARLTSLPALVSI
jgi:Green fluorescent protein